MSNTSFSFSDEYRDYLLQRSQSVASEVNVRDQHLDYVVVNLPYMKVLSTESDRVAAAIHHSKSPMHVLEALDLRRHLIHIDARRAARFLYLPEDIFSGVAPRLRNLELGSCLLSWNAPILRGLTALTLSHDHPSRPYYPPNSHDVYACLAEMRSLECLTLEYCLPRGPSLSRRVHLSDELHTFFISGSVQDSYVFLQNLTIPQLAVIEVRCNGDISSVRSLLKQVVRHNSSYPDIQSPYLTKLAINADLARPHDYHSYPISLGICGEWNALYPTECPFNFFYEGEDTNQTKEASIIVLEEAMRLSPLRAPRTLEILAERRYQPVRSWTGFFEPGWTKYIERVKLSGMFAPGCISAILGPVPSRRSPRFAPALLFPNLKVLHFLGISFWPPNNFSDYNLKERPEVRRALRAHRALGGELEKILIQTCDCKGFWVNKLAAFAPVKWDGRQGQPWPVELRGSDYGERDDAENGPPRFPVTRLDKFDLTS